jgi:hypothetical protein
MRDPALAAELVARMELDQQARRALDEGRELSNEGEAVRRVFEVDRDDTQPIEEPDGLDQRRAEMGLEPFEEYERLMCSRFP